jgi:hypothetical protein
MPADSLDGLAASNLPTIVVSCKCDNPENARQVSVENMEDTCSSCVEAVKTASNVPESARLCLSSMLKAIMASRNGQSRPVSLRVARLSQFILQFLYPTFYNYQYREVLNISRMILCRVSHAFFFLLYKTDSSKLLFLLLRTPGPVAEPRPPQT